MRKDRIAGKKISVLGIARSGIACAKLLSKAGADVLVSEIKNKEALSQEARQLDKLGITLETGGHTSEVIKGKDFIVVSPGIPLDIPILKQAQNVGIPIFSEIEVASWLTDAKIIGVTGSNGKTTTVTLLGEMLREDNIECQVGGNIGIPFSSIVEKVSPKGYLILELSSFQLERIEEFRPYISIVLNITPDHLDRHPNLESYTEAKLRIMENQTEDDFVVINADDKNTLKLAQYARSKKVFFSIKGDINQGAFVHNGRVLLRYKGDVKQITEVNQIGIRGPHNLYNACAACAICGILGLNAASIRSALRNFKGVEHRLEEVAIISGVTFINDSKATNVESVWYALQSVPSPIILIAGGKDKGGDFSRLKQLVQKNVKALILIGEGKKTIKEALGQLVTAIDSDSLEDAVELSFRKAQLGDTVLLSPGCASFDMFKDYEDRGRVFKQSVKDLGKKCDTQVNT